MHVADIVLDQVARKGPVNARDMAFSSFFEVDQILVGIRISEEQGLIRKSEVVSSDPEMQMWVLNVS